jgi:hypothetical protein
MIGHDTVAARAARSARRNLSLPLMWSADRVARFIASRLDARPARIDFPGPLATLTRAAKFIPRPLYDRIARGLRPPQ